MARIPTGRRARAGVPTTAGLTRELSFTPVELILEDGGRVAVDVSSQYERLDEDFEISDGIVLPVGEEIIPGAEDVEVWVIVVACRYVVPAEGSGPNGRQPASR